MQMNYMAGIMYKIIIIAKLVINCIILRFILR